MAESFAYKESIDREEDKHHWWGFTAIREDRRTKEEEDLTILLLQEIEGILLERVQHIVHFLITKQRYYYKKVTILKAVKRFPCARYYIIWDPGGDRSQLTSHSLLARDGPFQIIQKYDNGSYLLQDLSGKVHKTRVNGWQLKPYFSQVLEDQADAAQENLDSNEPLGLIAKDPSLAQHVPCITIMTLGPITWPCIDTCSVIIV